ncbi:MAG TPA: succinate--CoA ligase subunit alpha [Ardenticatenaceae bacterium]|nr:succinate--CoA ligase subunit alpha [Ardenticatenaceae bacterium]
MSILVNKETRLVVQGITGREGGFHTQQMIEYGTKVVAGVTPGKGGQTALGVPVFNTVREAVEATGANTSISFVPASGGADAIQEAADAGVDFVVSITENIPILDMVTTKQFVDSRGVRLLGPNCPGLLTPGKAKVGIIPGDVTTPGPVGMVSRSGTLTYEVTSELTSRGIGQSTIVGIGGDPIPGMKFIDVLRLFQDDPQTELIVLIGEIGGTDEEQAAAFIKEHVTKPVFSFIAGRTAPPGRRMGHAGAIITGGGQGTAESKIAALEAAGARVASHPAQIAEHIAEALGK